jgi:hypothetical protein
VTRAEAVEQIAVLCETLGAEKLPGRLRAEPSVSDIRQAGAFLRTHVERLEDIAAGGSELNGGIVADVVGHAPDHATVATG